VRRRAACALQTVYEEFDFPPISDAEVEAATIAHSSADMPERDVVSDLAAADRFMADPQTVLDVICALDRRGFEDIAARILEMQRQRITGDYLQTSAIFDSDFHVLSALNDPNTYQGPGSGYRLSPKRWQELSDLPQAKLPQTLVPDQPRDGELQLAELAPARPSTEAEVVIALGPAFGTTLHQTLGKLPHKAVLRELMAGIEEEGLTPRVVKIYHTADCAAIGHAGAQLSGSGIAIGLQSKGTTVIHRRDLAPLNNLELFSQSPNLSLASYRAIGRNAARYAKNEPVTPVPVKIDNMVRLRLIVHTTLMHFKETLEIESGAPPIELKVRFQ